MCYLLFLSTYRGVIYRMILKMYHFSHSLTTLLSCRSLKSCLVGDSNSFGPHGLNCDGWSPNDTMVKDIGSLVMCLDFPQKIILRIKSIIWINLIFVLQNDSCNGVTSHRISINLPFPVITHQRFNGVLVHVSRLYLFNNDGWQGNGCLWLLPAAAPRSIQTICDRLFLNHDVQHVTGYISGKTKAVKRLDFSSLKYGFHI